MYRVLILHTILIIFAGSSSYAGRDSSLVIIPFNHVGISVDGYLDDWKNISPIIFSDTLQIMHNAPGHKLMSFYDDQYNYDLTWMPLSRNMIEVMLCWDLATLYIAFNVSDQNLYSEIEIGGKYPDLHLNDGIEVYIDTRHDSDSMMDINDYQFLIDLTGKSIVFRGDRELVETDTLVAPKKSGQNVYFQYKTRILGTINDTLDDTGFIVEMAIPFAAIGLKAETGLKMRMDLCNNDIDYSLEGIDNYDEKAKRYWPFNWSGYSDFGYPDAWKQVVLSGVPDWSDKLSGRGIRRWLLIYMIVLVFSFFIIIILLLRMGRLKKIPVRKELNASNMTFLGEGVFLEEPEMNPNQRILKKATKILTSDYTENIGSERLSKELGVSIRKLQRITREEMDTTPTNFIYMVKLNLAADYLKKNLGNVSETAYEFGFSDPGYFSKLFKKHFGMSPLEYQEKNDNSMETGDQ